MSGHVASLKSYYGVFAALMVLLGITVWVAFQPLGAFNIWVAMAIAVIKMTLVILYFMHVKYAYKLVWIVVIGGFVWLIIMLVGTYMDYLSRLWIPIGGPSGSIQ